MIRCSKEVDMYDKFVSYASDLTHLFEPNLNFPGLDRFAIPPKFEARQYVPYGRLGHYNGFPFSLSTQLLYIRPLQRSQGAAEFCPS